MVDCVLRILFSDDILAWTSTGFGDVCGTPVGSKVSTKLENSKETWSPEVTTTPVASDSANGGDTVGPSLLAGNSRVDIVSEELVKTWNPETVDTASVGLTGEEVRVTKSYVVSILC